MICISAWNRERDITVHEEFYKAHEELFERLGIKARRDEDYYFCEFSETQIKGYQLLHVLLHEIGHHVDRIKTRSKYKSSRGEQYAENYAFEWEEKIWDSYQQAFNVIF